MAKIIKYYCLNCDQITKHLLIERHKYNKNLSDLPKWKKEFIVMCEKCKKYENKPIDEDKIKKFAYVEEISNEEFKEIIATTLNNHKKNDDNLKLNENKKTNKNKYKEIISVFILISVIIILFTYKNFNKKNENILRFNNYPKIKIKENNLNNFNSIEENVKKYEEKINKIEDCQEKREDYLKCINEYNDELKEYFECLASKDNPYSLNYQRLCFKPFNTCIRPICL